MLIIDKKDKMPDTNTDHDILISLRSEVRMGFGNLKDEIKDLKDNTAATVNDHETRLRVIEGDRWKIIGIVASVNFILTAAGVILAFLALK